MTEQWKNVPEFPNTYQVSSIGRLRRIRKGHNIPKGAIITGRVNHYGYRQDTLVVDGQRFTRLRHRLVASAFIPNPDGKETVNHKNGNKLDNCIVNLEWMTREENARHSVKVLGNSPWEKRRR